MGIFGDDGVVLGKFLRSRRRMAIYLFNYFSFRKSLILDPRKSRSGMSANSWGGGPDIRHVEG